MPSSELPYQFQVYHVQHNCNVTQYGRGHPRCIDGTIYPEELYCDHFYSHCHRKAHPPLLVKAKQPKDFINIQT